MRVTCPGCGAEMTLDVLLAHEESRRAMAQLAQLTVPMSGPVLRYLALFRPAKRQMSHARVVTLIEELLPDLQRAAITRKGREWAATPALWQAAIETVLAARDKGALTLPLTSHGYLYEVLAGLADKHEAQAERETEADRRGRRAAGVDAAGAVPAAAVLKAAAVAPPAPPAYSGPSPYARKVAAELAARKARIAAGTADANQEQEGEA